MFTGLITEVGQVLRLEKSSAQEDARIRIHAPRTVRDAKLGDSIAVNGVCLTVAERDEHSFTADVLPETLRRSALEELTEGTLVNLEPALRTSDRLGGHIVQGHVDGVAQLTANVRSERWNELTFTAPNALLRYVVEKGAIAVDGISLTVTGVASRTFGVAIIPTTLRETRLGTLDIGAHVNIEVDVLAKYVERLLSTTTHAPLESEHLHFEI